MSSENLTSQSASSHSSWFRSHPIWTAILLLLAALLLLLALIFILPFNVDDSSVSVPASSHDDALARITAVQEAEKASGEINPVCISNVMTHGEKTEKVLILYHGFTSCPEQFRELGETFFEQGYNIYIPRMPHHGHADQLSDALLDTSAEELATFATDTVDIGNGLGEEVIVGGLSGGGTISTWIAQEHHDVDKAVMVAPFLGIGFIPTVLNRPLTQVADNIPNIWMWWDPETKADNPFTQSYQYPRYPLHALAEYMRLGFAAQEDARNNKPGVESLIVITNANDESINNGIVAQIEELWVDHGEELIRTYQFEKDLGLPHDVITPTREDGNPDLVYPIIVDYISSAP